MYNKKLLGKILSFGLALAMTSSVIPVTAATRLPELDRTRRLELKEKEITELKRLNGDDLVIRRNNFERIRKIDGKLTEATITTPDEAKLALKKVSYSLGIDDVDNDVVFTKSDSYKFNSTYDFQQYYGGLEVVNSCVTVVVNNETNESEYLNSSYSEDISIDTTPTVTKDEAKAFVKDKYGIDVVDDNVTLVIYKDEETYTLAWKVITDCDEPSKVFINAKTGEEITAYMSDSLVFYTNKAINYAVDRDDFTSEAKNDIYPYNNFTVDMMEGRGGYKLYDSTRKIYMLPNGATRSTGNYIKTEDLSNQFVPLAVMHNVQKAYDFYKQLGLSGPNGKSSKIFVYPEYTPSGSTTFDNALSNTLSNGDIQLRFGVGSNLAYYGARGNYGLDVDIVTHEFTHGVTNNLVNWGYRDNYTGEMMALHEAYSDIMGELCDETREWQEGTDMYRDNTDKLTNASKKFYIRDIANPTIKYYTTAAEFDKLEGHYASQIISHAAYVMKQNGVSTNDLKNIWYNSLSYLPHGTSNVKFSDCREAVQKASLVWYLYKKYNQTGSIDLSYIYKNTAKVMSGFNAVHVYDSNYKIGDFNNDGVINSSDKTDLDSFIKSGGTATSPWKYYTGDLNFDGVIDNDDVLEYDKMGDINLDGVIDEQDYTDFKADYKNKLVTWIPLQRYLGDLTGDGSITTGDIYALYQKIKQ